MIRAGRERNDHANKPVNVCGGHVCLEVGVGSHFIDMTKQILQLERSDRGKTAECFLTVCSSENVLGIIGGPVPGTMQKLEISIRHQAV